MPVALAVLLDSFFIRFVLQGEGTPVPFVPPRRLVVSGLYRYTRNAMYLAVVSAILGQGLFFGDAALIGYAFLIGFACHVFVLLYEEPALRKAFGSPYETYCSNVPRWIPRRTPWRQD
jgi:protein-S-isoprenylcysteine O-methyltransferase Ste14